MSGEQLNFEKDINIDYDLDNNKKEKEEEKEKKGAIIDLINNIKLSIESIIPNIEEKDEDLVLLNDLEDIKKNMGELEELITNSKIPISEDTSLFNDLQFFKDTLETIKQTFYKENSCSRKSFRRKEIKDFKNFFSKYIIDRGYNPANMEVEKELLKIEQLNNMFRRINKINNSLEKIIPDIKKIDKSLAHNLELIYINAASLENLLRKIETNIIQGNRVVDKLGNFYTLINSYHKLKEMENSKFVVNLYDELKKEGNSGLKKSRKEKYEYVLNYLRKKTEEYNEYFKYINNEKILKQELEKSVIGEREQVH